MFLYRSCDRMEDPLGVCCRVMLCFSSSYLSGAYKVILHFYTCPCSQHTPSPSLIRQLLDLRHLHSAPNIIQRNPLHHSFSNHISLQRLGPTRTHQPRQAPTSQTIRHSTYTRHTSKCQRDRSRRIVEHTRSDKQRSHVREGRLNGGFRGAFCGYVAGGEDWCAGGGGDVCECFYAAG